MPDLPDVANVLRIRLIGTVNSSPWNVVHYARYSGTAPTDAELQTVGTAVGAAWAPSIGVLAATTTTLSQVEVEDLSSKTAGVGIASVTHIGNRAGAGLPNNVACVASYKIHVRYRGGHPRSYWPIGVQGDVTAGRLWSTTFLPLASNAASSYVGNINAIALGGGLLTMCAVSFYGGAPPVNGESVLRDVPQVYTVQSVQVHQRVDTMRSRLGKEIA